MEIKDAMSIYDFLGKLGYWGGAALSVIIIVIVSYLASNATEKITDNKKIRTNVVCITAIIIFVCSIIIIFQAIHKQEQISNANVIKNFMVSKKWRWLGYRRIAKEVNFPMDLPTSDSKFNIKDTIGSKAESIEILVGYFPDEFLKTWVSDSFYSDSLGVELTDTSALNIINSYNNEMLPFFRDKILHYMQTYKKDSISYQEVFQLDNRLQDYLIDDIIAKYGNDFIPAGSTSPYLLKRASSKR